jgi:hypothetical protein
VRAACVGAASEGFITVVMMQQAGLVPATISGTIRQSPRMIDHVTNQWRQDAAAVEDLPAGRFPLSAGEGSLCTINGEAGTLVRDGDYLVCRAKPPIGPTRSGKSLGDAQPGTRAYVDAVWNEMVSDLTNAWKT